MLLYFFFFFSSFFLSYAEALKHVKTIVNDKGWKQHSKWIKSLRGCIQLANKHLKSVKKKTTKAKSSDPFAAQKTGGPVSMMNMQQPSSSQQSTSQ